MKHHILLTPDERPKFYLLEGRVPVPCDLLSLNSNRTVGQTRINDVYISTVFLGFDHSFSDTGPPILFETMIFGGKHDQYQERCSTWDEAEEMHKRAVDLVNEK